MDQNNSYTELEKSVELLMNAFNNILFLTPEELVVTPTRNNLNEIASCLNRIFPENKCVDVLYTNNYDKLYFGIRVNPVITPADMINIIGNDEKFKLGNYKLEFDSKLFNMNLSPQELTAYTLYEVSSMVNSYQIIDDLRVAIDLNMTANDDTVYLKESAHYAQLVIFAIKDALTKLSSLIYKDGPEEYIGNPIISAMDLSEFLVKAHDSIITSENGPKDSLRASNTSIIQWMFIMYRDMRTNSSTVMDALKDFKTTTGSRLDIEEANKTIDAINRIDATITPTVEALELPKFFEAMNMSTVNEFSLFGGLKRNGLRSIEDYLYEAALRIKNVETEEDAVFIMRALSTRMNILIDYIYNTPGLSDREKAHWEDVYDRYARLREELVKKRIWNKKQYGLFFDYNQDFGDKPYEESADNPMDVKDDMTEKVRDSYEKLAGDSSRWNKVTQPEIDYNMSDEELEAELEGISFDPVTGEAIIKEESYDPEIQPKDDETSGPNKVYSHVDKEIDSKSDIKDVVDDLVPNSADYTIPNSVGESLLFGESANDEVLNELFGIGKKKDANAGVTQVKKDISDIDNIKAQQEELRKKAEALKSKNEASEACCEKCGSSNVTVSEGNCTCNECGNCFSITKESFNDDNYVTENEDESSFL